MSLLSRQSGPEQVAAIILAAGRSTRMGQPKMVLPWGDTTVLGQVIRALVEGGIRRILVVTGGDRQAVEDALRDLPFPAEGSINPVFNPEYEQGEMLSSLQAGLRAAGAARAALVVLGDQPQIEAKVIGAILREYGEAQAPLVVPSFQMHRGHPWLVDKSLWDEILALPGSQTLRGFLQERRALIRYVEVDTGSILMDLDSPQDYQRAMGRKMQDER